MHAKLEKTRQHHQCVPSHVVRINALNLDDRVICAASAIALATMLSWSCRVPPYDPESANTPTTNTFGDTQPARTQGVTTSSEKAQEPTECSPGATVPCSQYADGTAIVFPGGTPIAPCRFGQAVCSDEGFWGECLGAVGPALVDRCDIPKDDSNCNGIHNESCACIPTESPRTCGVNDTGACQLGTQACVNGRWTECKDAITPRKEVCDGAGKDEDCDGKADLADEDCECATDGMRPCIVPGKLGNCALGAQVCRMGRLSACVPRFRKTRESCAPPMSDALGRATRDEDCDGEENEWNQPIPAVGCEHYMVDNDGDGWGKIGAAVGQAKDGEQETHGCFCELPKEYKDRGFIKAGSWSKVSRDCGDSSDHRGAEVYPGHHKSFYNIESPALKHRATPWPGGLFDYNCDGVAEVNQGWDYLDCNLYVSGGCKWSSTNRFWKSGETPECGTQAPVPTCKLDPKDTTETKCIVDHEQRTDVTVWCR